MDGNIQVVADFPVVEGLENIVTEVETIPIDSGLTAIISFKETLEESQRKVKELTELSLKG